MTNATDEPTRTIDHESIVNNYFAAWNATDAGAREAAIAAAYSATAHLSDPLIDVTGHDQLASVFTQFHDVYAGSQFRQRGEIDAHHDLMRWGWEMIDADGNVALEGLDIGLVDEDGKLSYVAGFFGLQLPGT